MKYDEAKHTLPGREGGLRAEYAEASAGGTRSVGAVVLLSQSGDLAMKALVNAWGLEDVVAPASAGGDDRTALLDALVFVAQAPVPETWSAHAREHSAVIAWAAEQLYDTLSGKGGQ